MSDEDKERVCEECEHFASWEEYGNVIGDCHNEKAFDFIGSLDGVEDPAQAGCPYFDKRSDDV